MAPKDETTYDFPKDLIAAQDELDEVRDELNKLLTKQPWSVEPLPAWTTHETAWRASSRPDSPGWDLRTSSASASCKHFNSNSSL